MLLISQTGRQSRPAWFRASIANGRKAQSSPPIDTGSGLRL
jgi:hypothetical protein